MALGCIWFLHDFSQVLLTTIKNFIQILNAAIHSTIYSKQVVFLNFDFNIFFCVRDSFFEG